MYSVLLVDDENSVLDILKSCIAWNDLGVNNVITASDGKEAMETLERLQVNLLITDIKMPHMDGLELVRNVRRLYPEVHCILLTAHSEFNYAKEAIRLGVENYLLKPFTKEDIEQTVENALDNIYKNRHNSKWLIWNNMLRRWITGSISSEELSEHAVFLDINIYLPNYCCMCLIKKDLRVSHSLFRSKCAEELSKQYVVYHLWDDRGRFVFIMGGKSFDFSVLSETLYSIAREFGIDSSVAVAVGLAVRSAELLPLSYQSACDAIEKTNLSSSDLFIAVESGNGFYKDDVLIEEIRMLFHESDPLTVRNGYRHIATRLSKKLNGNADELLSIIKKACIGVLVSEFPMRSVAQKKIYGFNHQTDSITDKVEFISAAEKILLYANQVFTEYFEQLSPIVQFAIKYIQVSGSRGASIKDFCAKNKSHPAYLGHLFKQETGIFFSEYLTNHRINRSIVLFRNPDRKIKDIAAEVGFSSTSYFDKCFSKLKGLSPAKYRMEYFDDRSNLQEE